MTNAGAIAEIIATYEKYGWVLRRILLSPQTQKQFENNEAHFGEVSITAFVIDAAWFSRPPTMGSVAWEIRYLGDVPFALLVMIDENDPEFESNLKQIETRLRESVARKQTA